MNFAIFRGEERLRFIIHDWFYLTAGNLRSLWGGWKLEEATSKYINAIFSIADSMDGTQWPWFLWVMMKWCPSSCFNEAERVMIWKTFPSKFTQVLFAKGAYHMSRKGQLWIWIKIASTTNEWFSSNRIPMFCAQDSGIARGQTLLVATKKCMAWSCFCVKSNVFRHRMPHFSVILWETEVTNVGALKFQVSVWLMR